MNYRVLRMYQWLGVAHYVLEVLARPAAHIMSERPFSAVGGFVIEKLTFNNLVGVSSVLGAEWMQ